MQGSTQTEIICKALFTKNNCNMSCLWASLKIEKNDWKLLEGAISFVFIVDINKTCFISFVFIWGSLQVPSKTLDFFFISSYSSRFKYSQFGIVRHGLYDQLKSYINALEQRYVHYTYCYFSSWVIVVQVWV